MSKGPQRAFTPEQEIDICLYYWTRLPTGYYPSYAEVATQFGCSAPLIRLILRRNNQPSRTQAETRERRPCKPITRMAPAGEPIPLCACGCGLQVKWDATNYRWFKYMNGHYNGMQRKFVQPRYNPNAPDKQRIRKKLVNSGAVVRIRKTSQTQEKLTVEILTDLYVDQHHTLREIAHLLDVGPTTLRLAMRRYKIPLRTLSETLILRGSTRGERNPAWKGGVAEWEYASDWKRICKQIKDRDKWTCQHCGECRKRWGVNLHVHHIDGNKLNNHPDNLISLCAKCHRLAHKPQ